MFDWFSKIFWPFSFFSDEVEQTQEEIINQTEFEGFEKDKEALRSDWKKIGDDFRKIIKF